MNQPKKNDLADRLIKFSVSVISFVRLLSNSTEYVIIKKQLIRSTTSAGANYEEAQGGSSKADFLNKTRISLKEMRETNYWLKILHEILTNRDLVNKCDSLLIESAELKNILGAICAKADENLNKT